MLADRRYRLTFGDRSQLPADHWGRWYGTTSPWSAPGTQPARFVSGRCNDCAQWFTASTNGSGIDYCSRPCRKRAERRRRRAREHNAPGDYRWVDVMRQYAKQGNVCAYCQKHRGLPEPDHVTALSRGGRNDMANIVAACKPCNSAKSDMTIAEWNADRERRGLTLITLDLHSPAFLHLSLTEAQGLSHRASLAS